MDTELRTLLEAAASTEDTDWARLAKALQRRGYPSGKDGLKAVRKRVDLCVNRMISETRDLLAEEAKRLFAKHLTLESFAWQQYAPYWCDGETCNFRAYTQYTDINDQSAYDIKDPELREAKEEVYAMLETFSDDYLMFKLFGNHKMVKVTREGIFTTTYEHQ